MTQASENSLPRNESGLSNIKSIGPARAQLLQELLAIHTIHDLAEASAHLIEAALREASRPVQHNIIAQWIEHARHLATADRLEGFVKTLAHPHRVIPLGESQLIALVLHRTQYSVSIAKSTLPSGLYRLQLLISFQGVRISFVVHEIQRFQVL